MPDIDLKALRKRTLVLLKRALSEAKIKNKRTSEKVTYPRSPSGTHYYWRNAAGPDVELVVNSANSMGGELRTLVSLGPMATNITIRYPDDEDAVNALVAAVDFMSDSLANLLSEVHFDLLIRKFNELTRLDSETDRLAKKEVRKKVVEPVKAAIEERRRDLKKRIQGQSPRGGNTRTKREWRGDSILKTYARRVNDRTVLAERIKYIYDQCDGDEGWIEDLKQDATFQMFAPLVSSELSARAIRRAANDALSPREREPKSIACDLARQELNLPEQDVETLRTYYAKGNRLLKQERKTR